MKCRRRCNSCEKLDLHTIGWIFIIFETFVFYIFFQHNSRLWVETEQISTLGTVVIIVRAWWIVDWRLWDGMKPRGWWRGCDLTKSKQLSSPLIFFSLISSFSLLLQIKFSLMSKHISRKFQQMTGQEDKRRHSQWITKWNLIRLGRVSSDQTLFYSKWSTFYNGEWIHIHQ